MTLHVLDPGLSMWVVDFGRPAYRSLGVPMGGAADRSSLALGNALVGNPPDAAALEVTLAGPRLRADVDLACVLCGAPFALTTDRRNLTVGTTFTLAAGEELQIRTAPRGARAYLCIQGGLQVNPLLGSRSAFAPLAPGVTLACLPGRIHARFVRLAPAWNQEPRLLRVIDGPQAHWFHIEDFCRRSFTVTAASNRMGLRLDGEALPVAEQELVSEPVCPGTVQVIRDGRCIILGVDGQTIGGYPKIAQVISADLDKLGQLRPGDEIAFGRVSLEEAETLYRRKQAETHEWVTRLRVSR